MLAVYTDRPMQVQQFNEMLDSLAGWSIWRVYRLGAKCF
ncbi:Uncharacterised protein [Mycobacteroides abscessus subsp. bolletii]|nr:Uncharacterised protein [Mycobacteroides abscessus subsp. bolletii]